MSEEAFRKWEKAEAAVGRAYGALDRAMRKGDRDGIERASAAHRNAMMAADRAKKATGI